MHAKYQRRVPHLEQALHVKRTPADPSAFILTGPITITVVETPSAHSLDLKTSSTKSTEASVTSTSTSSSTRLPTSTTTFFVKVTQTPPPPTQIPPSSTPVPSTSVVAQQNAALNTPQTLSSGAIAGIVITCLFVLVAAVVFGMRRRFKYHRMKIRGMWTTSKAIGIPPTSPFEPQEYPGTIRPYPFPVPSSSAGNNSQFLNVPSSPGTYFASAQAASRQGPSMSSVLAPPASYGTGFGSQIPTTTTANTPFTSSDAALFPFGATVIYTFITSLPDELSIRVGETIRVLAEYDDGWALSLNARGEQGMVPLQCLDRGVGGGGRSFDADADVDMDGMRRVSSLNVFRR